MAYGATHEQFFYVNNWRTQLTAAILSTDTTLPIEGPYVDLLSTPAPANTRRYLATLDDGAGTREIIEITGRNTTADTITVVRAREGTTAAAFAAGTIVEMRITARTASLLGVAGINQQGNIFIGAFNAGGALASGAARNIIVGNAAANQVTTGDDNIVLGDNAYLTATTGSRNVGIGSNALQGADGAANDNTAVGHGAGSAAGTGSSRLTLVGSFADLSGGAYSDGLALGYGATLRASNQGVIGSGSAPITDLYIGEGVHDASPPTGVTINATGGSGSNVAGAPLRIAGGKGTGTGAGGKVLIATAPAGASGATQNALVDRAEWDSAGLLHTYGAIKTADPGSGAGAWKLGTLVAGAVALDTANYVEVEIGGTVRKLLVAA